MRLEAQVSGNNGGVIGETVRTCLAQLDGQAADLEDLRAKLRTQDWYHDLSEQGSHEEIQQIVACAEGQEANAENQSGTESRPSTRRRARNNAPQRRAPRINVRAPRILQPLDETGRTTQSDDPTHQRLQRLTVSQQQCLDRVTQVDARLEQFRCEIRQDVLDTALTLQRVMKDAQGQGQGVEQIRHNLFNVAMEKLGTLGARFQKYDEFMQQVLAKTDKQGHEVCTAVERVINEQGDFHRTVEGLARRIDTIRDGTHPRESPSETATQGDAGVAMQLELNDLKAEVLRLPDQLTTLLNWDFSQSCLRELTSQRIRSCNGDTGYQIFPLSSVEQAFTHEVEQLKDEWEKATSGLYSSLDFFERKQMYMDRQIKGLKSFATHVESFLEVRFDDDDAYDKGHIPELHTHHRPHQRIVFPDAHLHSMEPLRERFCKGPDMTSPAEYEAALCQLEDDDPEIRQYSANIREERWTHFSLEGVKFPTATVDVIHRGEALAIFERDLIIHFQQISRAAALYIRALFGGVKRTLEIYRRVDETTKKHPWSVPTTEEKRHAHAEGVLMVALTNLNLPVEAWKSARLLRAAPNCRLVLMPSYHMLSPALSVEEAGLMTYLQSPPDAGPSVVQVTTGLQNWKCAGRRLVADCLQLTQLHQSFIKILSKHLAANKKVSFVFQQKSSTMPMMNPSPSEIVELFSCGSYTDTICHSCGTLPRMTASSVKPKPKRVNKAEATLEESAKEETQANGTTPKPGKHEAHLRQALPRLRPNRRKPKRKAKVEVRVNVGSQSQDQKRGNSNVSLS